MSLSEHSSLQFSFHIIRNMIKKDLGEAQSRRLVGKRWRNPSLDKRINEKIGECYGN